MIRMFIALLQRWMNRLVDREERKKWKVSARRRNPRRRRAF